MKTLGLIVARGGSKGLPNKHLLEIAGKSVIEHVCEYVITEGCDEIILSSDSDAILEAGGNLVKTLRRPSYLARDNSPLVDVIRYIIREFPEFDFVMSYDGNWLRRPPLLDTCKKVMQPEDTVVQPFSQIQKEYPQWAVTMNKNGVCQPGSRETYTPCRGGLRSLYYPHNGAYFARASTFKDHVGDNWPEERKGFICEPGIDLDTPRDYLFAKSVMEQRSGKADRVYV